MNGVQQRSAFSGNVIPQQRLDAVALALQKYYPAPNNTNLTNNLVLSNKIQNLNNTGDIRIDQHFSDRDQAFMRLSLVTKRSCRPIRRNCYRQAKRPIRLALWPRYSRFQLIGRRRHSAAMWTAAGRVVIGRIRGACRRLVKFSAGRKLGNMRRHRRRTCRNLERGNEYLWSDRRRFQSHRLRATHAQPGELVNSALLDCWPLSSRGHFLGFHSP